MDIVRGNIRHLMQLHGIRSELELASRSGVHQTWIHRYMAGTIKKANPEKIAKIADVFGVTAGEVMWRDLTQPGAAPASQPTGREAEIMAAAVKVEAFLKEMSPVPLPEDEYAQRLYIAAQVVRDFGAEAILSGEKLADGARSLAAKLRAVGA